MLGNLRGGDEANAVPCTSREDCDRIIGPTTTNDKTPAASAVNIASATSSWTAATDSMYLRSPERTLPSLLSYRDGGSSHSAANSTPPTDSLRTTLVPPTDAPIGGPESKRTQPPITGGKTLVGVGSAKEHSVSQAGVNVGMVLGILAGSIILLLAASYGVYKCRSRDEGTYKIDETRNYCYEACGSKPMAQLNGKAPNGGQPSRGKRKDMKEWYV